MNLKNKLIYYKESAAEYILFFFKWAFLATVIGTLSGLVGTIFSKSIEYVTELRNHNTWLIFLLPIGAIIIVVIYKLCCVDGVSTNEVFKCVRSEKRVPVLLTPAIFLGSVITHLLGGSAGREGAALQLGGSIASLIGKLFKLNEKDRHIIIICGMSGVFSAVFGTPLCAAIFAVEVVSIGYMYSSALFPSIASSLTAYIIALKIGIKPEKFIVNNVPKLNLNSISEVLLIAVIGALVSIVFCKTMHHTTNLFKKYFKNPYIRAAIGGIILIILTVVVKTNDYNGGGINVIERIFSENKVHPEAFILKII